jgi:quinol-cytochrome oxidoreductase complex cytochrome b subunit
VSKRRRGRRTQPFSPPAPRPPVDVTPPSVTAAPPSAGFDALPVTTPSALAAPVPSAFDPVVSSVEITKPSPVLSRLLDAWPHLVLREATVAVVVTALVLALALLVEAPLAGLAAPALPDNPEKAPWYFVGMQEMVSYSAWSGAVLFPLALAVGLLLLPLIDRRGQRTGRWFADVGWPIALCSLLAGALTAATGLTWWESGAVRPVALNPAALTLLAALVAAGLGYAVRRRWCASGIALSAVLVGAYVVFTLVGALCRGPSWQFFWPWQSWPSGGPL